MLNTRCLTLIVFLKLWRQTVATIAERDDAMAKSMTPSATFTPMTDGQIDKAVANYRALLEKHRGEFLSDPSQRALGNPALIRDQLGVLRKYIEVESEVIIRHFRVDRTKTPAELLSACGRVSWYIDETVLASMPMDGPEEGDLVFFPLKSDTPVADIPRVLDERGLVLDPAALMQVMAEDEALADEHPVGTQWAKDSCACFYRFGDKRRVYVHRRDSCWHGNIWFAGRRNQ
ncbi:hypothetical protein IT399_02875 [Candidatus Nomurabacteria bacterium]|nr:hypothetical protein [Candidatus Nomurabacteria bacterium]